MTTDKVFQEKPVKLIIRLNVEDGVNTYYAICPTETVAEVRAQEDEYHRRVLFPGKLKRQRWLRT